MSFVSLRVLATSNDASLITAFTDIYSIKFYVLNAKHNQASFWTISTDWLWLRVAQICRS